MPRRIQPTPATKDPAIQDEIRQHGLITRNRKTSEIGLKEELHKKKSTIKSYREKKKDNCDNGN
jgi:hypothetical protein